MIIFIFYDIIVCTGGIKICFGKMKQKKNPSLIFCYVSKHNVPLLSEIIGTKRFFVKIKKGTRIKRAGGKTFHLIPILYLIGSRILYLFSLADERKCISGIYFLMVLLEQENCKFREIEKTKIVLNRKKHGAFAV